MIQLVPSYAAPVKALFGLANTPFEAVPFRAACEQFCTFDATSSDADIWYFSVGGPKLIVGVSDAGAVGCAVLSICWWETFLPVQHTGRAAWEAERAEFDRLYDQERARAITVLGAPALAGQDKDTDAHRWALWRGQMGLLVLQQSGYDPQFGLDINYWLHPWRGGDPRPGTPFINWLFGVQGVEQTQTSAARDRGRMWLF